MFTRRLLLALPLLLLPGPMAAAPPSFDELEDSLTCQCGCGLTVRSCNHLNCPSAIPLRQEIREQMALGLDKNGILDHFREKYGEKILSSPTTTGFNLTAWVAPFLAIALGGVFVTRTLLRWQRARAIRGGAEPAPSASPGSKASPYDEILEQELKRFEP